MEQLFKWFKDFFYLIIPGFVYFIDITLILKFNSDLNIFKMLSNSESYSLQILLGIILFSYSFGLVSNLAVRGLIWFFNPKKYRKKFTDLAYISLHSIKEVDQRYEEILLPYYSNFLLIRNLTISVALLLVILVCSETVLVVKLLCGVFVVCLLIAYYLSRQQIKIIESLNPRSKTDLESDKKA